MLIRNLMSSLFFVLAMSITISAQEPEPKVSADAKPTLDALLNQVSSCKGVSVAMNAVERVRAEGEVVYEQKTSYIAGSSLPNKFAMRIKSEDLNSVGVSDGKTMSMLLAPNAYIEVMSPATIDEIVELEGIPSGPLIDLLTGLAAPGKGSRSRLLNKVKEVSLVASEDEKAKEVVLRFTKEDLSLVNIVLSDSKAPVIKAISVDLTETVKRANPRATTAEDFEFKVTVAVDTWKWEAPTEEGFFTFTPPKDAQGYPSIAKLVEAMQGGPHPLVGKAAPDFKLLLQDGSEVLLSKHKGKNVVVLDFWATWCGPCRMAMPVISEVVDGFKKQGVVVYGINSGETKEEIAKFDADNDKLKIQFARDEEGEISSLYRVEGLPMTILVGKDGTVENVHVGFETLDKLRERLTTELEVLAKGEHLPGVEK